MYTYTSYMYNIHVFEPTNRGLTISHPWSGDCDISTPLTVAPHPDVNPFRFPGDDDIKHTKTKIYEYYEY